MLENIYYLYWNGYVEWDIIVITIHRLKVANKQMITVCYEILNFKLSYGHSTSKRYRRLNMNDFEVATID